MKILYLIIDFFTVIIPLIFSFHPRLNFYKNFKAFFLANSIVAAVFIFWDFIFTEKGIWGFNPKYVTGIYFFNLPIEEILFFICIPFACVFTYHCLGLFFKLKMSKKVLTTIIGALCVSLFLSGLFFYDKAYTCVTFISLSLVLFLMAFIAKVEWLGRLLFIYPLLLIPFFIVNGVLTGTGLQEPVVWYNNNANMGVRIITIPFEDIFYGFLLILLNIYLYEIFKKKFAWV